MIVTPEALNRNLNRCFVLIIAGAGAAAMLDADPNESFWFGGRLSTDEAKIIDAVGIGATILGGGLTIDGIVRMLLKR